MIDTDGITGLVELFSDADSDARRHGIFSCRSGGDSTHWCPGAAWLRCHGVQKWMVTWMEPESLAVRRANSSRPSPYR